MLLKAEYVISNKKEDKILLDEFENFNESLALDLIGKFIEACKFKYSMAFFQYRGLFGPVFHDSENDPARLFRFRRAFLVELLDRVKILIEKDRVFKMNG